MFHTNVPQAKIDVPQSEEQCPPGGGTLNLGSNFSIKDINVP